MTAPSSAFERSNPDGKPVLTTARAHDLALLTLIGLPFNVAPCPRRATNNSLPIGSTTTPSTMSPERSNATDTQNLGSPREKLTVPSSGSTIHLESLALATSPDSSASIPYPTSAAASSDRMTSSDAPSTSVTMSRTVLYLTRCGPLNARRTTSAPASAAATAMRSSRSPTDASLLTGLRSPPTYVRLRHSRHPPAASTRRRQRHVNNVINPKLANETYTRNAEMALATRISFLNH